MLCPSNTALFCITDKNILSGTDSIAIGGDTKATKIYSIAIGNDIHYTGESATAVGQQAHATGKVSTAIGIMTNVDADWNAAHQGQWRQAGDHSTAVGAYSGSWGLASTALGGFSRADEKFATAVGYGSHATAERATTLGAKAEANAYESVAIGAFSVADREGGMVGAFAPEGADGLTWKANAGAVSVGSSADGKEITRQITNVAAGSEATDAVNVAQLKAATENAGWNLSTEKEITNPTKVKAGAIVDFSGDDENISVSKEETDFATLVNVKLNKNLKVDSVNAGDFFMNNDMGIGFGGDAYITQNGLNANDKVITNVAAGVADTDAVNVGQLKNSAWKLAANGVLTEAEDVKAGDYVDFNGDQNVSVSKDAKDGVNTVKVELNKDLLGIETISNGDAKLALGGLATELTNGQGASVKLFGDATIINGKVNVYNDGRIAGVAAGINDTDAVNVSQLKNSAWKLAANGVLTEAEDVKAGDYVDFSGDQNVSVSKDVKDGVKTVKVELNKDLVGIETISNDGASLTLNGTATELTNGKGAAITLFGDTTTINNKVTVYNDGRISGVAAGINDTDAVNVSQLKAVGTTANMGWNLATNGVATEATNVKPGEYVDFSGDKNISVSHDGTKVKVELNKDIDVNYVQTNALNSKYNLSVGTMAENGIMPFFVNSTGDFYAAHNKFHVDKDGKVTATAGEIGNVVLQNGVYYGHSTLQDGSLLLTDDNGNHSYIDAKGAKLGKVTVAEDGKITGVAAGAITADSTDAVNGSQLHAVATEAGKHSKVVNGSNINVEEFDNDGQKIYKVNLNKDIMLGDLTGKYVSISGTNGTIEATGAIATKDRVYADKGAKLADIDVTGDKISNGASSIVLDGSNVKVNDKVTIDQNGKISGVAAGEISNTSTDAINGSQLHQTNENVAALDKRVTQNEADIAKNKADIAANRVDIDKNKADIAANRVDIDKNKADIKNLDNRVTNVEELAKKHTTVTAGDNISVTEGTNADGGKEYTVALDKNITVDSVKAGDTTISDKGLEIKDGPSVTKDGIYAGDKKITGVADGKVEKDSKDAINGGQLHQAKADINNRIDGVENQVVNNTNRINKLGSRVNKVGAGAAALAALHPMDFDPDDKLTFSAGYGNYAGENAAAIGAYYRPDEKVMFSVAGTVGNGENMVNAGVSFALDRTNHVSNSRTALAREVIDLRGQLAVMGAKMAKMEKAFGMLDETKTKLFPDVPANHWAYEYIAKLAGNGYIEGYPDGNFGGDRLMTRYEFAAMLYRAIENGAALEEKIIKEFEPELGRIRVDRISGEDGDRDKIERVRVNDTKGERDHYGNKLAK